MKTKLTHIGLTLLFLLSIIYHTQGQSKFTEWGKVTIEDLNIKECSFEKNAEAILLLDLGEIQYKLDQPSAFVNGDFLVSTYYYQRFKVLTEDGVKKADFAYRYRLQGREEVYGIKAICYNLENNQIVKTELQPKDIHVNKLNEDVSEVVFSVPGVKKGSVFEVIHTRDEHLTMTLPEWSFSSNIPVVKSSIKVGFLNAIQYYVDKHFVHSGFEESSKNFYTEFMMPAMGNFASQHLPGTEVTYTTHNLPSSRKEPYMSSRKYYTDWVAFQLYGFGEPFNIYYEIINNYARFNDHLLSNQYFGGSMSNDPLSKKLWKESITDGMSTEDKAKIIFDLIRTNVDWDGNSAIVSQNFNSKIWKNKVGSSAEINLLLINTLRQAGIKAYPMLVGGRTVGYTNKKYPVISQFKNVVALVEAENGKKIILDATDKYAPFGMVDYDLLNTDGYVVYNNESGYWHHIVDVQPESTNVLISAGIDNDGKIDGEITIAYTGYTAVLYSRLKSKGKEAAIMEKIKTKMPTINILSVHDTIDGGKNRYIQKIKFSTTPFIDNDNNAYISIPTIYGTPTNPFVLNERVSDIDFGYLQKENVILQLTVPDTYAIDSIIKPMLLRMPDTSITFQFDAAQSQNGITIRQKAEFSKPFYEVGQYLMLFDFYHKYFDLRQQPVVLRKKK